MSALVGVAELRRRMNRANRLACLAQARAHRLRAELYEAEGDSENLADQYRGFQKQYEAMAKSYLGENLT